MLRRITARALVENNVSVSRRFCLGLVRLTKEQQQHGRHKATVRGAFAHALCGFVENIDDGG